MVNGYIDIHKLNLDELNGVISLYPWFGAARAELCRRMSELGEGAWSDSRYADAALYVASRRIIAELAHKGHKAEYADSEIKELLRAYIDEGTGDERKPRRVVVVGGDYFSQDEYASVRREDDNMFAGFARLHEGSEPDAVKQEEFTGFCTEALAQIYAEQGYYEQAKQIYSQLSLRFPEKSAYFAALIEKLKK